MPPKPRRIKETKAPYRAKRKSAVAPPVPGQVTLRWEEVEGATGPIVLKKNGRPVAVLIRYDEYRQLEAARAERRQQAWRELEALLERIHARTREVPIEEVEADITTVRQAAQRQHHALRGRP